MTLQAAKLLDEAWEVYYKIATETDPRICNQSPSWRTATTPYDHAANLCKSLIPLAYNIQPSEFNINLVWDMMVDSLQTFDIKDIQNIVNYQNAIKAGNNV
jgi:hypothetical protein